ncbi:hypothetical protein BU16DRAFT_535392 [Lophium mytilinum]|uniref:Uncharacterized protein n=1 Tax=Lophium mytilinum TaxID=390894 RepID=A0A6A6R7S8_9PEZI|nr:hypothetical protein BU16DRAFT_535392 [Lophium mytilinum]
MPSNKPRLQLALYARPKHPESYYYAHTSPLKLWRYEHVELPDVGLEQRLLARVFIGKLTASIEDVEGIVAGVPVYQVGDERPDVGNMHEGDFSCRTWLRDGLLELETKGLVAGLRE